MKNNVKIFLMLLCTLAILLASVACNKNGNKNPDDTTPGGDETTTTDPNGPVVLTLNATEITLGIGESKKLSAKSSLTNMETSGVLWMTDNPSVASVDTSGNVKGLSDGTAVITVSTIDGTSEAKCTVSVTSKVTGVNIIESNVNKEVGDTFELTYTLNPENAANSSVTWKSEDESVATVSPNGVITAVGAGTTSIMIKTDDGGYTDACNVTVIVPVKGISLTETLYNLNKGVSVELGYTITPANATNKSVMWSSNNDSVAIVSSTGRVTAMGAGSAKITVTTSNGLYASCIIDVKSGVTGVTISHDKLTLKKGEEWTLTAEVLPADASNRNVTWSSTDSTIATVSQSGIITARKTGEVVITVVTEDGKFDQTCEVKVINPLTSITLDKTEVTLSIYDAPISLIPTFEPLDADNIADAHWSSTNNKVATVDANGVITPIAPGTAEITLSTEDGIFATCTVVVSENAKIPVSSITVEKRFVTLRAGEKHIPVVKVLPLDAGDKSYILTSNSAVVRVDADGTIVAISKGTAIITVSSVSNPEVTQTISVEVKELTQDEITNAVAQYNAAIEQENSRHLAALATIDSHYSYLADLKNKLDAYDAQKATCEKNISDYQLALIEAENSSNVELINQYTALIEQEQKALNDLQANYPNYSVDLSIYSEENAKYKSETDAENKLHTDNIGKIKSDYEFIKQHLPA